MVFSSHLFIFYFLPLALLLYYAMPQRYRNLLLTLVSYVFYGWVNPLFVVLMIVAVVVLLGVRLTLSMLPQKPAASASAAVTPAAPAPEASVVNPLSRSIEVTGFRIVTDPSKKPEIHYLVVNHTPVRVSNMTVYVTLRTADDKPGQPPLSRFSFAAPNLGPFQSKEMISSIEKMNRPVALPEWQDLRADLEIGQ
jgi:hypothetical protein